MKRRSTTLLAIALIVFLAPLGALADTHVVDLTTSGGSESTSHTWLGDDRMAVISDDMSFVYRGDLKKIYIAQHAQKKVFVVDLPFDLSSVMPPQMAEMMDQMVPEVTVTPRDETKTIAGYEARRYDLSVKMPMGVSSETTIYVSKDVPIDWTLAREMGDEITRTLSPQTKAMLEKLTSVEGYQLGSETVQNVMGTTINVTKMTQSIEEAEPPEGIYEPPAGYEQQPLNMQTYMQMMQQGG